MAKTKHNMKQYGLIGKNIAYSFSKKYFQEKFKKENLEADYQNFDCQDILAVENVLNQPGMNGFNVTIPYKETIISYLDEVSETAKKIGAVNCIQIESSGKKIGHNTDWLGFKNAIQSHLTEKHQKALILGTGGASKAIRFALESMGISCLLVSRNPIQNQIHYDDLDDKILNIHKIIVHTTPVGTFPEINQCVDFPYSSITKEHLVFDLIYNPEETCFLKNAKKQGATTLNGLKMLLNQAEIGWEIWNL
jgi:shikimate dehydrogenase